jgi:anthranilate synthase component 1
MTPIEFEDFARSGFNRIPVVAEAFADLDTPLGLYLKLTEGAPYSFLLESVVGGERFGRYSIIGLPARTRVQSVAGRIEVLTDDAVVEQEVGDPLAFIERYRARFKAAVHSGLPRFCGGLAGYFGYDTVRHIEPRLAAARKPNELGTPDILLLQTEELAVIDNLSGRLYLIVYANPAQAQPLEAAQARLAALKARLALPVQAPEVRPVEPTSVQRVFAKADFLAVVERCKAYIAAGDCMQVVIGQRLQMPFNQHPLSLYRALRSLNPSPYLYYYNMGGFQIVGSSPEILVRQERDAQGQTLAIRPIAGTRPRGANPAEDARLEAELLADPKERAEHLMLIDLARNDIGRIAQTGSVQVTEAFGVERYSHVMHIVSHVQGRLKPGLSALDVLRASFPAGTLSGAPKIRAMEIIDELEPTARGIYGGAVGYLSFAGDMDVAIAIRTGVVKDGMLYVQAGAGVVADSVPELEWQETEAKARAVLRAAECVQAGF